MSQPPTAAIVVAVIFVGLGATFVGYKVYRRIWWHRQQALIESSLPPVREPSALGAYGGYQPAAMSPTGAGSMLGVPAGGLGIPSTPGSGDASTLASPYSTMRKMSYDPIGSGGRSPELDASDLPKPGMAYHSRNSSFGGSARSGIQGASFSGPAGSIHQYDSAPASPTSGHAALPSEFGGSSHHYPAHARSINGSTSSTMALQRSYTPSLHKGLGGSAHTQQTRRDSYLPHLNRESMMIVPPQPLGFGTSNSMAMATDQKTLVFGSKSGIGASDDFSSAFRWIEGQEQQQQQDPLAEPGPSGTQRRGSSSAAAIAAERERYLRQGPSQSASVAESALSRASSPSAFAPSRVNSGASHRTSPSSSQQLPLHHPHQQSQYPPSAATFKGLHQFAMHNGRSPLDAAAGTAMSQSESNGTVSTSSADGSGGTATHSGANSSAAHPDESPIMSPFRVTGVSASRSGSGSVAGSTTDGGTPSTGPTTAYTESSGRLSRNSGSFAPAGAKAAEDLERGETAGKVDEQTGTNGYFSSAASYGAGLFASASQVLRSGSITGQPAAAGGP